MLVGSQMLGRRILSCRRLQSSLLHSSGASRPLSRPTRAADKDEAPSEAPEVGWMWQTGPAANKAGATRANLKQANIKAKK